ncbi:CBS domain-containing protein, partial [Nocardioides sp.]|uniref:CBS domain-containing protein n=1 Tax=Nocardioides sp. TaxID=35761 RepID=UPI00273257DB
MLVREVMTTPAVTVHVETSVKTALTLLAEHSVTSLPVVGHDGQVIGVVSEADLIRDGIPQDIRLHLNYAPDPEARSLAAQTVGEVMSHHPVTVSPDTDLHQATELMTSTTVKSLPVVDDQQRVVGVVSRRDVVRVLAQPDNLLAAEAG